MKKLHNFKKNNLVFIINKVLLRAKYMKVILKSFFFFILKKKCLNIYLTQTLTLTIDIKLGTSSTKL